MEKIKIEFFHDVICSFCFPMSFRMRQLKETNLNIEIIHRSFGLVKQESDFTRMFGSREDAKHEIMSHWAAANQNDDLHRFNIEGMKKQDFLFPISMKPLWACKAALFVAGENAYWDVFDALQAGFFVENKNIELESVIFEKVKQLKIDFEQWKSYFYAEEVKIAVQEDFALAEAYKLNGVPALVINEDVILTGAVSLEEIKRVIAEVAKKREVTISQPEMCGLDGKCK